MKRMRSNRFEEILLKSMQEEELRISLGGIERFKRLVWCYNNYIYPNRRFSMMLMVSRVRLSWRTSRQLPEIKSK